MQGARASTTAWVWFDWNNPFFTLFEHDDVIKWKHFPRYWPFVCGIHRPPMNFPDKGQWRRTLMFSLICACINRLVNNHGTGDLRRHLAHYDATLMGIDTHIAVDHSTPYNSIVYYITSFAFKLCNPGSVAINALITQTLRELCYDKV